ncbi:MAG: RluA family pseudouridine synthase [bacterium]
MILKVHEPIPLSELLLKEFQQASRTTVKKLIAHGNVRVNGKMVTNPAGQVNPGDVVEYTRQPGSRSRLKSPFRIFFEDEYMLVVEKPVGILTVGDIGSGGTSLYKMMLDYVKESSRGKERIFVVHRLDKEVSGLLVFAKSEKIQEQIKADWENTRKLYYVLVQGNPPKDKGTLRSWLKEGKDQHVFSSGSPEGAKLAITHYRVTDKIADYALLEVELETGRKNQIRVHLADMGCPVVGDRRYGAVDRFDRRIRLHAFYLSLNHPATGVPLEFKSPMPKGFLVLKEENEKYK